MTVGETLYLALVLATFGGFAVMLAYATRRSTSATQVSAKPPSQEQDLYRPMSVR